MDGRHDLVLTSLETLPEMTHDGVKAGLRFLDLGGIGKFLDLDLELRTERYDLGDREFLHEGVDFVLLLLQGLVRCHGYAYCWLCGRLGFPGPRGAE